MKRILIYFVLMIACINAFPQNDNDNMLKYWYYRNRLKYFVIPGTKQGESEIISQRNALKYNYQKHIAL